MIEILIRQGGVMKQGISYTKINKALMSLPIFLSTKKKVFEIQLETFYGYSNIHISGKQLNAGFDLKLFCCLLGASQIISGGKLSIPLYQVREWDIATDSKGKKHIAHSLSKMTSVSVTLTDFSKENTFTFNILSDGEINNGHITATIDPDFLNLFWSEKFIYNLKHSHLADLSSLSARAMFIHLQSNQGFPKFKQEHLAIRLGVSDQPARNQNRAIEKGLNELKTKGFVSDWSKEILGGKIRNYRVKQCSLSDRVSNPSPSPQPQPQPINPSPESPELTALLRKFDFSFDDLSEPILSKLNTEIFDDDWSDQDTSHFM